MRRRAGQGAAVLVVAVASCAAWGSAWAVEPAQGDAATLAAREAELLARYQDLERSFLRLADVLQATDPRRAAALRAAFDRAREEQVGDRVAAIVAMLERGQFLKAGSSQQDAIGQFRALLDLLEAGAADQRAADTAKQLKAFMARITKQIAQQRDIEGVTEAGGSDRGLTERQRAAADETRTLGEEVERFAERNDEREKERPGKEPPGDQQPGDQQPGKEQPGKEQPAEGDDDAARGRRTAQRLRAAEQRMREALERLENTDPDAARGAQERAIEELETARAELEEILRQLREEEVTRLLVQLETRLRGMLKAERGVLADAERLAAAAVPSDRERQLEAARLGREQGAITAEAGKALVLLRDDGSAVAIPQALAQVHEDSGQAAGRLARGDTGRDTLGLLGEIVTGLEEMLAAVERARADQQDAAAKPGGGRSGEAGEQPLVDKLAELKMLRSLQARVNGRTQRLARLLDAGDSAVDDAAVKAALTRLAGRQREIERAARDIVEGLTE
jgi:tetratricopeptide (TPR) repeat protein